MSKKIKNDRQHFSQQGNRQTASVSASLFPSWIQRFIQYPHFSWIFAAVYGLVILGVGLQYHVVGDYNVETDFFWSYVPEAKSILHKIFVIEGFRGPAYPVLLAGAGSLLGDFFRAGIVLSVFSAAGVLYLSHELFRRFFQPDIALFGTLLIAVNKTFIQYSYTASTDMVFNFVVTASLFFLLQSEQRRWLNIILSSIFAAIAYLTRYNGVFIVAAVPLILLFINCYDLQWKERWKTTAVFLGIFLLAITPWGIYCYKQMGSFFYNQNYLNIAYEMFAKGKIGWDQFWNIDSHNYHSLLQVVFSDPGKFIGTLFSNVYAHFTNDIKSLLLWPLGVASILGILVMWWEKPTIREFSLLVYGVCFFGILLLVFYSERFSMFLLLIYVTLAIHTLTWKKLTRVRLWNYVQISVLISWIVLVWTFSQAYEFNMTNINSGPQEVPLIADWFIKNYGKGNESQLIVTRKPHIAYYLGMSMSGFPYVQNEEELRKQVKDSKASYLFFSTMEAYMRPQFQTWLDPRNAPSWLIPITYTISPPAVLYKVNLENTP